MILQKATLVQEELINVAVLTRLIAAFCASKKKTLEALPIENLIIEMNLIEPEVVLVDLKPLIMEEVIRVVGNVIKKLEIQNLIKVAIPLEVLQPKTIYRDYVALSTIDQIEFVKMDDIMFCMADGKYTKFYLANGTQLLSSKPLGNYENRVLDVDHFYRIHHSYIINMRFVTRVDKREGLACQMTNGVLIPISKRKQDDFCKFIRLK
jgi:two-component system LytT family response regulator